MTEPGAKMRALIAILRRDLRIFTSYRTRTVSQLISVIFSLTLFYYISRLVRVQGFRSPNAYFAYVVVGLSILHVIYSCFGTPALMRQELVAGTFERLLLSPFGAVRGILAMTLFPFLYSLGMAAATLVLAWAFFGLQVEWATAPLALPLAVLSIFAFVPFGLLFAAGALTTKQALGASWVVALLSLMGGLYFPVALLPHWVQGVAGVQPFTAAVDLLRHVLVGFPLHASVLVQLAKLVAFSLVLLPLSLWALNAALGFGQRRGTITEY